MAQDTGANAWLNLFWELLRGPLHITFIHRLSPVKNLSTFTGMVAREPPSTCVQQGTAFEVILATCSFNHLGRRDLNICEKVKLKYIKWSNIQATIRFQWRVFGNAVQTVLYKILIFFYSFRLLWCVIVKNNF